MTESQYESQYNKLAFINILMFLMLACSITTVAKPGYTIIPLKGEIKAKKKDCPVPLKITRPVNMQAGEAIMVYPHAVIDVIFPDETRKQLKGPLYANVETLKKKITNGSRIFFQKPSIWKCLKPMLEYEGDWKSHPRGEDVDTYDFLDEIRPIVADQRIKNRAFKTDESKETETILKAVDHTFNAFSYAKQQVIRALVYKALQLHRTALDTVFSNYQRVLNAGGKDNEDKLSVEYQLFHWFLPIDIQVDKSRNHFITFSWNFPVWWAAYSFNGKEIVKVKNMLDYAEDPTESFKIPFQATPPSASPTGYLFIIATTRAPQLDEFNKEIASRLIADPTPGTKLYYGTAFITIKR